MTNISKAQCVRLISTPPPLRTRVVIPLSCSCPLDAKERMRDTCKDPRGPTCHQRGYAFLATFGLSNLSDHTSCLNVRWKQIKCSWYFYYDGIGQNLRTHVFLFKVILKLKRFSLGLSVSVDMERAGGVRSFGRLTRVNRRREFRVLLIWSWVG